MTCFSLRRLLTASVFAVLLAFVPETARADQSPIGFLLQQKPGAGALEKASLRGNARTTDLPAGSAADAIRRSASTHGVPASLALRVAWIESRHRCNAVNPRSGASGPLQIMPASARGMGYRGPVSALRSCGAGLVYGMLHLKNCYRLAGGSESAASACHLSGPAAMHARTRANSWYAAKVRRASL